MSRYLTMICVSSVSQFLQIFPEISSFALFGLRQSHGKREFQIVGHCEVWKLKTLAKIVNSVTAFCGFLFLFFGTLIRALTVVICNRFQSNCLLVVFFLWKWDLNLPSFDNPPPFFNLEKQDAFFKYERNGWVFPPLFGFYYNHFTWLRAL